MGDMADWVNDDTPAFLADQDCPCICHEQTSGINAHNDKCRCNGGTGMETL